MFLPAETPTIPLVPKTATADELTATRFLAHRVESPPFPLRWWWLAYSLAFAAGAALVAHIFATAWDALALSISEHFGVTVSMGYAFAVSVLWAVVWFILSFFARQVVWWPLSACYLPLLGCVVVVLGRVMNGGSEYKLFGLFGVDGLVVLFATWVAYRITFHYAAWMAASPQVSVETAMPFRVMADSRQNRTEAGEPEALSPAAANGTPTWSQRWIGWGVVVAAYAISVTFGSLLNAAWFADLATIGLFVIALIAVCLGWAFVTAGEGVGLVTGTRLALRAAINFLFYNRLGVAVPGVFQSPMRSARRRGWLVFACIVLLGFGLAPARTFLTVVPEVTDHTDSSPLEKRGLYNGRPEGRTTVESSPSPKPVRPTPVTHDVSFRPHEALVYQRLGTAGEKRAFVQKVMHERASEQEADPPLDSSNAQLPGSMPKAATANALTRSMHSIVSGQPAPVWALIAALLAALLLPCLLVVLITAAVGWPVLATYYRLFETKQAASASPDMTPWEQRVRAIYRAEQPTELDPKKWSEADKRKERHLWLGVADQGDFPALLARSILEGHFLGLGKNGGGKTSMLVMPTVMQLIRMKDRSVVIIDMKGDLALMNTARIEAEAAGLPFKYFTNLPKPTFGFNPLTQSHMARMNPEQRLQLLLKGMGLDYGEFYGGGYFGAVNKKLFRSLSRNYPHCRSFASLMKYADRKASYGDVTKKAFEDGGHMVSVLQTLAGVPALNVEAGGKYTDEVVTQAIDLPSVFDEPQVVYFHLSGVDEDACRGIAKLALYTLLTAADPGIRKSETAVRTHLVIDEFQQVAGPQVKRLLQQARSAGLHCLLSHQSLSDLKTRDGDFTKTVLDNVGGRVIFSAGDMDVIDWMVKNSGVRVRARPKWTQGMIDWLWGRRSPEASTYDEVMADFVTEPRLSREDILAMSVDQNRAFVQIEKDAGLTRFNGTGFIVRFGYPITYEVMLDRNRFDLLPPLPGTFVPCDEEEPPHASGRVLFPADVQPSGLQPSRTPQAGGQKAAAKSVSADPLDRAAEVLTRRPKTTGKKKGKAEPRPSAGPDAQATTAEERQ